MAGIWSDLFGSIKSAFQIGGTAGVRLKNSSANLLVRNAADSADAQATVSKINVSGNDIVINSDAAGSAADWLYTLRVPSSGMTAAVVLTLPVDDGTPNQILATDGSGVLSWASAGSTAADIKIDTTTIAFGASSPVTMFTTGAADIIDMIEVIIDTAFDTAATLTVGIAGTTSKYSASTDCDLTATAGTCFQIHPNKTAQGAEALITTYSAASATVGSARVIVHYATPS